jgi:hypothetical protein
MKLVDGAWTPNPSARWAISDTTRNDLQQLVTSAFEQETPMSDLADQIEDASTFDEPRASMIAKTESHRAQQQGNLRGWKATAVVEAVEVSLSPDHDEDASCDCAEVAEGGPYDLDDAPDLPVHPNCECIYRSVRIKQEDDEDGEDE